MKTDAVIYRRVSTGKQLDGVGLDIQEEQCREYCATHGYRVADVYSDVYSAYDTMDVRPGLNAALEAIRQKKAAVLVVWKMDRLSREQTDGATILRQIDRDGGRVESVKEGPAEQTGMGKLMSSIRNGFSEMERESIIMRTQPAIRRRAENGGLLVNGRPKFGYTYTDPKKLGYAVDEEAAVTLRRIYDMCVSGRSVHDICRWLNDNHVPTPTARLAQMGVTYKNGLRVAKNWGRTQVYRILRDPAYAGNQTVYRFKQVKLEAGTPEERKTMRKRDVADPVSLTVSVPAIVDEATWQAVQSALDAHSLDRVQDDTIPVPLLNKGFVVCGACGSNCGKEHVKTRTGAYTYIYRCNSLGAYGDTGEKKCPTAYGIRHMRVDEDVWEKTKAIVRDQPRFQRLVDSRTKRLHDMTEELSRREDNIRTELDAAKKQQQKWLKLMEDEEDPDTMAVYRVKLREAVEHVKKCEEKAARGQDYMERLMLRLNIYEEVGKLLLQYAAEASGEPAPDPLDSLSREDKRRVLRMLGVQVKLYGRASEYARTHDGQQWEFTWSAGATDEEVVGSVSMRSSSGPESRFW